MTGDFNQCSNVHNCSIHEPLGASLVASLQECDADFTTQQHCGDDVPAPVSEAAVCVWDSGVMRHSDWMEQPGRNESEGERSGKEREKKENNEGKNSL